VSSHVVAIDELESSLHPDLVSFFLQMFLLNANNSQLIVTTHAQYLMEQDYMRNDMVWFCEKQESGTSEYYSAQDFKLHKNNNLANFYRAGKLGAKPVLGSPLFGKDDQ
jgi:AAA15 family ATPase/GTPase